VAVMKSPNKSTSSKSSNVKPKKLKPKSSPIPKQKEIIELLEKLVEMEIQYGPMTLPFNKAKKEALMGNTEGQYTEWLRGQQPLEERIGLSKKLEKIINSHLRIQTNLFNEIDGVIIFKIPKITKESATCKDGLSLLDVLVERLKDHFTQTGKDCWQVNQKTGKVGFDIGTMNPNKIKDYNQLLEMELMGVFIQYTSLTPNLGYKAIARIFEAFELEPGTHEIIYNNIRTREKSARNKLHFQKHPQV
jgi:hypothetical protein